LKGRIDFPSICCKNCKDLLDIDDVKPDCFDGKCPVGFEDLTPSDLRILDARSMLMSLTELGLSDRIAREMDFDLYDLRILSAIEFEVRALLKTETGVEDGGD
jgi:hypothetical protein